MCDLTSDLQTHTWNAIKKTLTKFRMHPLYFFTESDIHSYFYHCMYSSRFQVNRDGIPIYLIHREYPTNFRYSRDALLLDDFREPFPLSTRQGDRGNFDIAVINPTFARNASSVEHVINKNVQLLEQRVDCDALAVSDELLFAIEFKYVTRNSGSFVSEVMQDNKKLLFAKKCQAIEVVNLVFCNFDDSYAGHVENAVLNAPEEVHAFFAQSYYDTNRSKSQCLQSNVQDDRYQWLVRTTTDEV